MKSVPRVRTVLTFLTIALLIVQGVLFRVVGQVTDADRVVLLSLIVLLFLVIAGVVLAVIRPHALLADDATLPAGPTTPPAPRSAPAGSAAPTSTAYEYDVFLSSPMASLDDAGYAAHRDEMLRLVRAIEERCSYRCYYAGRNRPSASEFEAEDVALRNDLRALRNSRFFLMVMPETRVSSVLVEAGVALAMGKPSVYLRRPGVDLPFVLRGAANSTHPEIPRIRMYLYRDVDDAIKRVEVNGRSLFDHTT